MLSLSRRLLAFVGYIHKYAIREAFWVRNGAPAYCDLDSCDAFVILSEAGSLTIPRADWLQIRLALTGTGIAGRSLFQVTQEGQELLERSREG